MQTAQRTAPLTCLVALLLTATSCLDLGRQVDFATEQGSRFELFVLGVAQDGGLPHLGCTNPCCDMARATGMLESPACLGIHDTQSGALALIEATPGVEAQIARLHKWSGVAERTREPVEAILLTHAHIGHYLGLAQFGREVAATHRLPVHVSARMADFLRNNGPWSQLIELEQLTLCEFTMDEPFEGLPELLIKASRVPHRDEFSDTVAFTVYGPHQTVLFAPDVDSWTKHPGLLENLIEGVDVAYLDATFFDGREVPNRNLEEIPHPPMVETMRLLEGAAAERPGRFRFLHMNHSNPAWFDHQLRADLEQRGFRIAVTGERIAL